jgi:hypothetical protein
LPRHHHGIDAGLRHRAVRRAPEQTDLQAIGGGSDNPGAPANGPGWPDHDVLAEHDIGLGEAVEEPVIDHCLGAFGRLLRRLEHRH